MANTYREPARTTPRRIPGTLVAGLVVVIAAIAAASGYQVLAPSSWTTAPTVGVGRPASTAAPSPDVGPSASTAAPPVDVPPRGGHRGPLGEADGAVPDGTTAFDDAVPGVANLDPALLDALRRAATDAAGDGIGLQVTSGWRSPAYQDQLLREAVSEYGSEEEAARWVATADTSLHVSGDAVDIGPSAARAWLSDHGDDYGLCQVYGNEPWHFELRPEATGHDCPPMYADPTQDPRMQR